MAAAGSARLRAKTAELGYDVVQSARRVGPLRAVADQIGARHIAADASDPVGFATAISPLDTIDLVVHAAGVLGGTYARKQTFDRWRTIMACTASPRGAEALICLKNGSTSGPVCSLATNW